MGTLVVLALRQDPHHAHGRGGAVRNNPSVMCRSRASGSSIQTLPDQFVALSEQLFGLVIDDE